MNTEALFVAIAVLLLVMFAELRRTLRKLTRAASVAARR